MAKNELSEALDAFTTQASRVWLAKWLKDNPRAPLFLPLKHGQALTKEVHTHSWINQKLQASQLFKEALRMLEYGTTTVPQMQIETRLYNDILPRIETIGL